MATSSDFPHLHLSFQGSYSPRFAPAPHENAEVQANRDDPVRHANKIFGILEQIRQYDVKIRSLRKEQGLPTIPADKGFLLKLPEGVDVDALIKALGVELVAETEQGLMLVSSEDLQFTKLEEVLRNFSAGTGNATAGSSLLDIYEKPDDERRLRNILSPEVLSLWPLIEDHSYILDLGIQTAASTRNVNWPSVRRRKDESDEVFLCRREAARKEAWIAADTEWLENAEIRVKELEEFIRHYSGQIISGLIFDQSKHEDAGIVFPDSVQVRIKMNGAGFRDVILNFAHLFEVTLPPDIQQEALEKQDGQTTFHFTLLAPAVDAPSVCVIDSGIQEEHKWLAPAIDSATSQCFLPGTHSDDTSDYVAPKGHGTRVAGAVLYPSGVPVEGDIEAVAWIQNARVLDNENKLPYSLSPEEYLSRIVAHFHVAPRFTKIYNHSINANVPCPLHRMTAWAAKLDQLSHEKDVLFIQSAGNQDRLGNGDKANPGLGAHLDHGRQPPDHQLEASMRVASPAQSLHALTVGSVSDVVFENAHFRSFVAFEHAPSGFSRAGYGEPWSVVKPEVVEIGGDLVYSKNPPRLVRPHTDVAIELLNSTMHGASAYSKDGLGTSFATPKVTHIAVQLQALFPEASPLLYRALIVQSARWPSWAENSADKDRVLRLIGYGLPSLERATCNSENRVTLITPDAEMLPSKQFHLYTIRIPEELRSAAKEAKIRIDVTLSYTALPRRTRARRTGYLETWLDWEASRLGEPKDEFAARMENGGKTIYHDFPWTLNKRDNWGEVQETNRNRGSVQKDWAIFDSFDLPEEFAIAVRSHKGWNHLDGASSARYCIVVSFEVLEGEVPIYALIENEIRIGDVEIRTQS